MSNNNGPGSGHWQPAYIIALLLGVAYVVLLGLFTYIFNASL